MHGAMSSPSLEKQKRQTDSCARSGSPSAPRRSAAPSASASAPKSSRQMPFFSLNRRAARASRARSAAGARSEPIASDSSYMKDWRPTRSVSTDQLGFQLSGW
jgi:hypothetical protein